MVITQDEPRRVMWRVCLGMDASLCLHFSGWSVLKQSSHTSVILIVSKMLCP